jgi:hypothetical protein
MPLSISSTPAPRLARKQCPTRPPLRRSYHYDGRDMVAVLEQRPDGYHVTDPKGVVLGVFPTRQYALSFINARIASPPALPIKGEREADAKRIQKIRFHQQQAKAYRARRSGTR